MVPGSTPKVKKPLMISPHNSCNRKNPLTATAADPASGRNYARGALSSSGTDRRSGALANRFLESICSFARAEVRSHRRIPTVHNNTINKLAWEQRLVKPRRKKIRISATRFFFRRRFCLRAPFLKKSTKIIVFRLDKRISQVYFMVETRCGESFLRIFLRPKHN